MVCARVVCVNLGGEDVDHLSGQENQFLHFPRNQQTKEQQFNKGELCLVTTTRGSNPGHTQPILSPSSWDRNTLSLTRHHPFEKHSYPKQEHCLTNSFWFFLFSVLQANLIRQDGK